MLQLPDNVYNWIESFFRDHSHCTKFNGNVSSVKDILASIVQGSAIGPASYVVTASDLSPITPGNVMSKYADDTYLIVPASNIHSVHSEIQHTEEWAHQRNNLALNRTKSAEVVITAPRSRRQTVVPPPAIPGFARIDSSRRLVLHSTTNCRL